MIQITNINNLPSGVLVALATGRKELARSSLIRLVKEEPHNVPGWLCLAVTLPREHAMQALRRALIIDPDNPGALRGLKRLRENPGSDFSLELSDVWLEEDKSEGEETLALFGNEQPTMPLRVYKDDIAQFGDEVATMPAAFQALTSNFYYTAPHVKPVPARPVTEVHPPVVTSPVTPVQASSSTVVKKAITAAPVELPTKAVPVANPVPVPEPVRPARPISKSFLHSPIEGREPLIRQLPVSEQVELILNRGGEAADSDSTPAIWSSTLPPKTAMPPRMPRLQDGPRPGLGTSQEPLFGFTGFGLLVVLGIIAALVLLIIMTMPS